MTHDIESIIRGPVVAINVGLRGFAESLQEQGGDVTQVDWVPPASGDKEMIDLLANLM
jgi:hypothetical protein